MTQKNFDLIAGVIFALVALAHVLRIAAGWDIIVGGHIVPLSVSWVGFIVAAVLAIYGLRLGRQKTPS